MAITLEVRKQAWEDDGAIRRPLLAAVEAFAAETPLAEGSPDRVFRPLA